MAINTAEKRRSAGGAFVLAWMVSVTPDALKDSEWRREVAWIYSGVVGVSHGSSVSITLQRTEDSSVSLAKVQDVAVSLTRATGVSATLTREQV